MSQPTSPWAASATETDRTRYADASTTPYWLDAARYLRLPCAPLEGAVDADLCIVGGGFTGLWAALHAKREDPARDVVLLEAATIGFGASGRNGGFVESSLTHGLANGLARFPHELEALERLAAENFAGMVADIEAHAIDCALERQGALAVAVHEHELEWLEEEAELARAHGHEVTLLDGAAAQAEVASPTYRGALWTRSGSALVDPARLTYGLRDAALRAGVRIHEHSAALRLHEPAGASGGAGSRAGRSPRGYEPAGGVALADGSPRASGSPRAGAATDAIDVITAAGRVRARRVLLGTSAFPPLLKRLSAYVAPVYDYALMTEPLSAAQKAAIGWRSRQGIGDMGNQFHYYRLSADGRILFGGYDAVYRYGGPVGPQHDDHDATFATLSRHFAATFPQLADEVRFSHKWGGAIDTCSRFSVFFGTAHRGKVAYAVGYTGLGVAATRFGAQVALDLLDGRATDATRLDYVRRKPVPFPPEPVRSAVIQLTRNRLAAADRADGRRGLWLRTLDRLRLGFDS